MSAQLTLAVSEDYPRLAPLMEALDAEVGVAHDARAREAAIMPLLEGSPLGAVYIIGPTRAPIGFLVMTLTWSLDYGGIMASVREIYVRPGVRGRGIAPEAMTALVAPLRAGGVRALGIEVAPDNDKGQSVYARALFQPRPSISMMVRKL